MSERKNYEMSQSDLDKIMASINAARNAPLVAIHTGMPPSPQEVANREWMRLGRKMGFDWKTVQPSGRGDRFFSAMPTPVDPWAVIGRAQDVLATYVLPGGGPSATEALNQLLGILDAGDVVLAKRSASAGGDQ